MKATIAMALFGAVLISGPAMAQTTRPADQTPAATHPKTEAKAQALFEMKPGEWRATKLTGLSVYNPDNQKIGDISELIIDRNGKVDAVVIGVGGFLGMGEHLAAVPFEKVQWVDQPVGRTVATTPTGTTGSGTSTAPTAGTGNAPAGTANAPATTTTTVDRQTGSSVTTTTEHPAGTTTVRTGSGPSGNGAREAYRGYPDHAVVAMTKEQLKALPEVRYAR